MPIKPFLDRTERKRKRGTKEGKRESDRGEAESEPSDSEPAGWSGPTLMPPIRSSPLNSRPFFSQWMAGVGFPAAAQRNLTVLAAGMASSFFSMRSGLVQ